MYKAIHVFLELINAVLTEIAHQTQERKFNKYFLALLEKRVLKCVQVNYHQYRDKSGSIISTYVGAFQKL